VSQGRKRQKADAERLTLLKEVRALLHHLQPGPAAEPVQAPGQPREE